MTPSRRATLLPALIFLAQSVPALCQNDVAGTVKQMEQLEVLQSRMAQGDRTAVDAQTILLASMGATLLKASSAEWKDGRFAEAGVKYLLAGGSPRVVEQLVRKHGFLKDDGLLMGALAYVSGREPEARDRLESTRPSTLPRSLGAQTAFMMSVLTGGSNPGAALDLLDLARTLAPGGLLEEAALRREIVLLTKSGDAEKAFRLLRQYVARFDRSLFAERFFHEFVALVPEAGLADRVSDLGRMKTFMDALPANTRRSLLLAIARTALLKGAMDVVEATASEAIELANDEGADAAAGHLYRAAAKLAEGSSEAVASELRKIEPAKLHRRDSLLLAGARELALGRGFKPGTDLDAAEEFGAPVSSREEDAARLSVKRAEQALSRVAPLLEK